MRAKRNVRFPPKLAAKLLPTARARRGFLSGKLDETRHVHARTRFIAYPSSKKSSASFLKAIDCQTRIVGRRIFHDRSCGIDTADLIDSHPDPFVVSH